MTRFTRKVSSPIREFYTALFDKEDCIEKLGALEDIEEELGIDLITFVKVCLQNKLYSKFWDKYVYFTGETEAIYEDGFYCHTAGQNEMYLYEDYGKTWALTKEELENDK